MRRVPPQLRWLLLALLLAACAADPARLLVLDNTATLSEAALAAPAAPLLARGVTVVAVLSEAGDSAGADFADRLAAAGLLRGGQIAEGAIGVYASLAPRYSELRVGERWSSYVPSAALERIRQEVLNPALRADRAEAGFAGALAAIEAEIQIQRGRERVAQWVVYGLLAALILAIGGAVFYESYAHSLRRSAPGRFIAWLWSFTPMARAAARRRLHYSLAYEGTRLDECARKAGRQLELLDAPPDLRASLAELAARRPPLAQAEDLQGLRQLVADYDPWQRQAQALIDARAALRGDAADARRMIEQLRADMQRTTRPTRSQRKGKPPRPVTDEERAQLAALEARLADLDAQRAAQHALWAAATDRLGPLRQLGQGYEALEADARALWRTACPEAYAAAQARHRAASSSSYASSYSSSDSASSSSSSSSDSASSSSSDWSSGSSDSGGESRAGGDW